MKVDMSAKAVTARLQLVSQLRRLCLALGQMKPVAPTNPTGSNGGAQDPQSPIESPIPHDLSKTPSSERDDSV